MGAIERRRLIAWAHEPSIRRARRLVFAFVVGVCAWDDSSVLAWAEVPTLEARGSLDAK